MLPGKLLYQCLKVNKKIENKALSLWPNKKAFNAALVNNTSVSSSPNHHTKVKFDPDLRVLTHKSFSFFIFEDKTESFQCVDVFSRLKSIN
jgi:hypothetical protein